MAPGFDLLLNGRTYHINSGPDISSNDDIWAVNDVTKVHLMIHRNLPAHKALQHSRWVAYANTREDAIAAAEKDAHE